MSIHRTQERMILTTFKKLKSEALSITELKSQFATKFKTIRDELHRLCRPIRDRDEVEKDDLRERLGDLESR
jgi:hypothetical protein